MTVFEFILNLIFNKISFGFICHGVAIFWAAVLITFKNYYFNLLFSHYYTVSKNLLIFNRNVVNVRYHAVELILYQGERQK